DWREGLLMDHFEIAARAGDARPDVASTRKARAAQRFAAIKNFAPFTLELLKGGLHGFHRPDADERSHENPWFQGVSDGNLLVCCDQPFGELRHDGFVRKHPASGGAALA